MWLTVNIVLMSYSVVLQDWLRIDSIKIQGLLPQGRQFVHLSEGDNVATMVGKRRDSKPRILEVRALDAYKDGISFYHGNEDIWLSDPIPPKYIDFE